MSNQSVLVGLLSIAVLWGSVGALVPPAQPDPLPPPLSPALPVVPGLNADFLDGKDASVFLGRSEKAADSELLDGRDSADFADAVHDHDDRYYTESESDARFLGVGAKAADSELLDGLDSAQFLRSDASGTLRGDLAIAGSLELRGPRPWVDVRAYGAKGDGIADDTAAIQGAVDALGKNGGTVFLPPGEYQASKPIGWNRSGVRLVGAGSQATMLRYTNTTGAVLDIGRDTPNFALYTVVADLWIHVDRPNTAVHAIRGTDTKFLDLMRVRITGYGATGILTDSVSDWAGFAKLDSVLVIGDFTTGVHFKGSINNRNIILGGSVSRPGTSLATGSVGIVVEGDTTRVIGTDIEGMWAEGFRFEGPYGAIDGATIELKSLEAKTGTLGDWSASSQVIATTYDWWRPIELHRSDQQVIGGFQPNQFAANHPSIVVLRARGRADHAASILEAGYDDGAGGTTPVLAATRTGVGVGTRAPDAALRVVGDIRATGPIAANTPLPTGDVAEPVTGTNLEPGDVVVADGFAANGKLRVKRSEGAYGRGVVGVVSSDPSLRLAGLATDTPLAVAGIVNVKVVGPVEAGDLLTTSAEPGHAMACISDARCTHGVTLGKALEAHGAGAGVVRALVSIA